MKPITKELNQVIYSYSPEKKINQIHDQLLNQGGIGGENSFGHSFFNKSRLSCDRFLTEKSSRVKK